MQTKVLIKFIKINRSIFLLDRQVGTQVDVLDALLLLFFKYVQQRSRKQIRYMYLLFYKK